MGLIKVISGGQTGADQGGWRAARKAGFATGGWMPKGYRTEGPGGKGDAFRPEFNLLYDAQEHEDPRYQPRSWKNLGQSDGTILFGDPKSKGGTLARAFIKEWDKPCFDVASPEAPLRSPREAAAWIELRGLRTLNIAGNRESAAPGIGAWVEAYMAEVLALLKADRPTTVVSVRGRDRLELIHDSDFVYVGRAVQYTRWRDSPWGNPFTVKSYGERAVLMFQAHLDAALDRLAGRPTPGWERPDFDAMARRLPELKGKRLGCWCCDWDGTGQSAAPCHAVALARAADDPEWRL